jgi:hypothetical protein
VKGSWEFDDLGRREAETAVLKHYKTECRRGFFIEVPRASIANAHATQEASVVGSVVRGD